MTSEVECLEAELYAAVHDGNPGDVAYYLRHVAGDVLELGCGAGRMTTHLVRDGREVVGLDLDGATLAMARARGLRVLRADMRSFALGRRFDSIIVPYNGLYCLLTPEDVLRCLRQVRDHLAAGGRLLFDGYSAAAFHHFFAEEAVADEAPEHVASVAIGGRRFDVYEESAWEPEHQVVRVTYRHVPEDGGAPVVTVLDQRYLLPHEVMDLLARAGLALVGVHGDFDDAAFDDESPRMIVHARA